MIGTINIKISIYEGDKKRFQFPFAESIEIKSARNTYSDTATVIMPQNLKSDKKITDLIRVGDRITIEYGYNDEIVKEFDGYIKSIDPNSPMKLECEDEAFLWKMKSIGGKEIQNATFETLVKQFYDGKLYTVDASCGNWTIKENATLIDVLDEIKSLFYVDCYWQDKALYVGYELLKQPQKNILFDVEGNVPLGTDNLVTLKQQDIPLVAYGLSTQKKGSDIELYAYFKDNSRNDIVISENKPSGFYNKRLKTDSSTYFRNNTGYLNKLAIPGITKAQLEQHLRRFLPHLYYTGVTGDISTFGAPSFKHGDTATIKSLRLPERNGKYEIIAVHKTFTPVGGIKQKATLGLKL